ncbi:MAG: hypothetical protein IKS72_07615 [Prevotella sp.]|nr:hypothetical protein [Prevotella sp.]
MTKLFYLIASSLVVAHLLTACEDDVAKNPGDFNLKPTLEVEPVVTSLGGASFELNKLRETDTTNYNGEITAKFIEYELVTLPSPADTFSVALKSNAKWKAPIPGTGGKAQWYYRYSFLTNADMGDSDAQRFSGGDGTVSFRVSRNKNFKRPVTAVQDIITADSTFWIRLNFTQKGEKDAD